MDKSGNQYGTAVYDGYYGNGSAGATVDNSCTVPVAGTPWSVGGTGVFVAASINSVDLTTPCSVAAGSNGPFDSNKNVSAVADAGLNNTDEVGGFIFTVYFEDVAASSALGANTSTSSSFTSTLKGVSIAAVALPVELSHFRAKANAKMGVDLTWQTASELNNDFFEIQRSRDGFTFDKIGSVKGSGTSTISQQYKFEDQSLSSGLYYYRLRQVDFDGRFSYSDIKSVDIYSTFSYQVYPTIITNELKIIGPVDKQTTYHLVDILGRTVKQGLLENENITVLDVSHLPLGSYYVTLSDGMEQKVYTLVKRN